MKPSPCLHPIFITDATGARRAVPCGHCAACLVNKGRVRTERLDSYLQDYPYQFFITLTYEDKNLPLARFSAVDFRLYHDVDCDYDGCVYSYDLGNCNGRDLEWIDKQLERYGGVPVLCHRHVILFKKKLRYYLQKKFPNEKLELFLHHCGEYGPCTYRPHMHFILGSKQNFSTDFLKECVNSSWSLCSDDRSSGVISLYGFTYVERVSHRGCANYVAKYLSCTTHLPWVLARAPWRPFSGGSTRATQVLSRLSNEKVEKVLASPALTLRVLDRGKYVDRPVPDSYVSRFFPLIPRFNQFADHELYALYSVASQSYGDHPYKGFMNGFLSKIPYNKIIGRDRVFSGNYVIRPLTILQKCVDISCFHDYKGQYIDDPHIQERNFMRLWYISKRVISNALECNISVQEYVNRIKDYYKKYELDKLKRFYEMQSDLVDDLVHPEPSSKLMCLYYSSDETMFDYDYYSNLFGSTSKQDIGSINCHRLYAFQSEKILLDTTKTKKRNDYFISRGLKRKAFIPILPHSIYKFKTI